MSTRYYIVTEEELERLTRSHYELNFVDRFLDAGDEDGYFLKQFEEARAVCLSRQVVEIPEQGAMRKWIEVP